MTTTADSLPYRSKCTCSCHQSPGMLHFTPCCAPDPIDQANTTVSDERLAELIELNVDETSQAYAWGSEVLSMARELSARRATADMTECLDRAEKRLVEFALSVDDGLSQGGAREWERRIWASFAELRDLAAHQAPE